MTTEQEKKQPLLEKQEEQPAERAAKKPSEKPTGQKRRPRQKKPKQQTYDHLPIIIALLLIFSFMLFCIGIGLTNYLSPERAGIPVCDKAPCSSPFAETTSQKSGGE